METKGAIMILTAGAMFAAATGYAGNKMGKGAQAEVDFAIAATDATDAFVHGACNGNISHCNLSVKTTGGAQDTYYRIVMGNVYRDGDIDSGQKPDPVLLPESCTTVKTDLNNDGSSVCTIAKFEEPASTNAPPTSAAPPGV